MRQGALFPPGLSEIGRIFEGFIGELCAFRGIDGDGERAESFEKVFAPRMFGDATATQEQIGIVGRIICRRV
jgi:hypothetical protein